MLAVVHLLLLYNRVLSLAFLVFHFMFIYIIEVLLVFLILLLLGLCVLVCAEIDIQGADDKLGQTHKHHLK